MQERGLSNIFSLIAKKLILNINYMVKLPFYLNINLINNISFTILMYKLGKIMVELAKWNNILQLNIHISLARDNNLAEKRKYSSYNKY